MKKLVYIWLIAFLCSCNQQTKQQDVNSSQSEIQPAKEEVAVVDSTVADSATDEEMAQRSVEYKTDEDEGYTPLELEQRAEEEARLAKGEEMIAKLAEIEEQINYIKNGEFSRSVQSVLYFRREGTHHAQIDYAYARKYLRDSCNEMIELYQRAMSITSDYGRMDLYNAYADEIAKLNNILDEL